MLVKDLKPGMVILSSVFKSLTGSWIVYSSIFTRAHGKILTIIDCQEDDRNLDDNHWYTLITLELGEILAHHDIDVDSIK